MKVIGIDVGTTSICGVVMDAENGSVLRARTENSNAFIQTAKTWERIQNVSLIVDIAAGILNSYLSEYEGEILAIGITGQMHGIVYVDSLGRAVSPLYTWQDGRGNLPYRETTYAKYLGSFSGYGNVTDFYNRENGLVPKDAVTYCTVHDYLGMVLCQNRQPIVHSGNAASLGLYDMEHKKFHYDYHPTVTDGFQIIGTYRDIPVSVAIGDNQASVFSTLADPKDLLINIGTGSQISIVSDQAVCAENIESRPYFEGKYLVVGSALCGGRAYSLLKDFYAQLLELAEIKDVNVYGIMEKMLERKKRTDLKVDTRFDGTRSNAAVTGGIHGITVRNFTPADVTVGLAYGMLEELYEMYLSMGEGRVGIVGSGNGIRKNKALKRIAEEIFGGKLRTPQYTEEAACGAALFALVSCGKYKSASDVQKLIRYAEDGTYA